jgi:hypothetical protein
MRSAVSLVAKGVAAAVRPAVSIMQPLRNRWTKYWDVDHRAVNFVSEEEAEAVRERQREEWNAATKQQVMSYSKAHLLPRIRIDILGDKPSIGFDRSSRYVRGNLLKNNPVAFHLLLGGASALYLTIVIVAVTIYKRNMPQPKVDAKASNKLLMSKRLAIIEHELGIDAERKSKPQLPIEESTTASRAVTEDQWRSVNSTDLKRLDAELASRRQGSPKLSVDRLSSAATDAIPSGSVAMQPPDSSDDDMLRQLDTRLRAIEAALSSAGVAIPKSGDAPPPMATSEGNAGGDTIAVSQVDAASPAPCLANDAAGRTATVVEEGLG